MTLGGREFIICTRSNLRTSRIGLVPPVPSYLLKEDPGLHWGREPSQPPGLRPGLLYNLDHANCCGLIDQGWPDWHEWHVAALELAWRVGGTKRGREEGIIIPTRSSGKLTPWGANRDQRRTENGRNWQINLLLWDTCCLAYSECNRHPAVTYLCEAVVNFKTDRLTFVFPFFCFTSLFTHSCHLWIAVSKKFLACKLCLKFCFLWDIYNIALLPSCGLLFVSNSGEFVFIISSNNPAYSFFSLWNTFIEFIGVT